MKVLVTGGTGVVGRATVSALLGRGHEVRLLTRHAARDARQWRSVEPHQGAVSDPDALQGAADGCGAVLHIVGIVRESPPQATFDRVNVRGTEVIVREAERAGVRRLVFVSSLGADRGESPYHRSKRAGEAIVRQFDGEWVICRPGNVYGPGDDEISLLLRMVRTSPAIPLVGTGDQEFQPIWHADLAEALALAVERDDLGGRVLELAGAERTSQRDLIERLSALTGRSPVVVPVPEFLASLGVRAASALTAAPPFTEDQLVMLREGNVIEPPAENALSSVFGITPTPLDEGLRLLVREQPELLLTEGVGDLHRKRFWADITGSALSAEELFERICSRFAHLVPLDTSAEPGSDQELREGATITLGLPARGNIQVRVDECTARSATLVTLAGHPLAGIVHFACRERPDGIRFEITVYDRPASAIDFLLMRTIGDLMQDRTWEQVVRQVVGESGGTAADGVQHDSDTFDDEEAERVERWAEELVMRHRRAAEAER